MSDEINVISRTQIVVVEPSSGSVSIINAGPPGPISPTPGPPGATGAAGVSKDTRAVRRVFANDVNFVNTSIYALFAPTAETNALKLSFTKQAAGTLLVVHLQAVLYFVTGNPRNFFIGVTKDGGATIQDVVKKYAESPSRVDLNGIASISGIAAGAHIFQPMFKADEAAFPYTSKFETGRAQLSYSITESMP